MNEFENTRDKAYETLNRKRAQIAEQMCAEIEGYLECHSGQLDNLGRELNRLFKQLGMVDSTEEEFDRALHSVEKYADEL